MSNREDFEEAASRLGYRLKMEDTFSGEYMDVEANTAWHLWQEAIDAAAREQEGGEVVSIGRIESINPMDFTGAFKWKPAINGNIPKSLEINAKLYTHPHQSQGVPEGLPLPEVGARHPEVVRWRNNAIEASAKIAAAYGYKEVAADIRKLLSTPAAPQADEWVKCSQRLPKPRSVSRTAKNGILVKFDNGRITQFREVSETLISNMRNGPRQPMKFESPNPAGIVEWMDLDESPQPPEQGDGV